MNSANSAQKTEEGEADEEEEEEEKKKEEEEKEERTALRQIIKLLTEVRQKLFFVGRWVRGRFQGVKMEPHGPT